MDMGVTYLFFLRNNNASQVPKHFSKYISTSVTLGFIPRNR